MPSRFVPPGPCQGVTDIRPPGTLSSWVGPGRFRHAWTKRWTQAPVFGDISKIFTGTEIQVLSWRRLDAQTADSDSDTSRSVRPPGRPRSRCPPRCLWFVGSARQRWDREPPSRHGYTGHSCTVGGQGQGCCSHSRPACLVANRPVRTARATGVADHVTASGSTLRAWPRTMQGPTSPASTPKGPQTASRTAPSAAT